VGAAILAMSMQPVPKKLVVLDVIATLVSVAME
jgi:hypothetical protein